MPNHQISDLVARINNKIRLMRGTALGSAGPLSFGIEGSRQAPGDILLSRTLAPQQADDAKQAPPQSPLSGVDPIGTRSDPTALDPIVSPSIQLDRPRSDTIALDPIGSRVEGRGSRIECGSMVRKRGPAVGVKAYGALQPRSQTLYPFGAGPSGSQQGSGEGPLQSVPAEGPSAQHAAIRRLIVGPSAPIINSLRKGPAHRKAMALKIEQLKVPKTKDAVDILTILQNENYLTYYKLNERELLVTLLFTPTAAERATLRAEQQATAPPQIPSDRPRSDPTLYSKELRIQGRGAPSARGSHGEVDPQFFRIGDGTIGTRAVDHSGWRANTAGLDGHTAGAFDARDPQGPLATSESGSAPLPLVTRPSVLYTEGSRMAVGRDILGPDEKGPSASHPVGFGASALGVVQGAVGTGVGTADRLPELAIDKRACAAFPDVAQKSAHSTGASAPKTSAPKPKPARYPIAKPFGARGGEQTVGSTVRIAPVLNEIKVISKPGRRLYTGHFFSRGNIHSQQTTSLLDSSITQRVIYIIRSPEGLKSSTHAMLNYLN